MSNDPLLAYFGHPILPAGYNSAPNDGDEIDGAGYNEPVWPVLFDAFVPLEVLIVTPEMLEVFEGCADLVVPSIPNLVVVPVEPCLYVLPAVLTTYVPAVAETTYVVDGVDNVVVFPADQRTLVVIEERKIA